MILWHRVEGLVLSRAAALCWLPFVYRRADSMSLFSNSPTSSERSIPWATSITGREDNPAMRFCALASDSIADERSSEGLARKPFRPLGFRPLVLRFAYRTVLPPGSRLYY